MCEYVNKWMSELVNKKWMNKWINNGIHKWLNKWLNKWINRRLGVWSQPGNALQEVCTQHEANRYPGATARANSRKNCHGNMVWGPLSSCVWIGGGVAETPGVVAWAPLSHVFEWGAVSQKLPAWWFELPCLMCLNKWRNKWIKNEWISEWDMNE